MILLLLFVGGIQITSIVQQEEVFISFEQLCWMVGWTPSIGAYLGCIVQNIRVPAFDQSVDALKQMNESWVRNKAESLKTDLLVS